MDDSLDDLFGDEPLADIPALSGLPPVAKGLAQSTDDARVSGCSQKIAWSNQGCIANISSDCHTVTLRNLYCEPATGLWVLGEGEEAKIVPLAHNGYPLKHLSWSHSGTELVITDILGNISVFALVIAINRCTVSRRCVLGAEDNLSTIVGLSWLNQDRSLPLHRPAVKTPSGQWAFMGSRFRYTGPHNPHLIGEQQGKNKAAIVVVTRAGIIRLIYQGPDGARWLDFKGELHAVSTTADLLSHASICADKDSSLLVATYSVSRHIRLHRVEINWSKQNFDIFYIKTLADCSPIDQNGNENGFPSSEAQLYHLEIVPPAPDFRNKGMFTPLLLAYFSNHSQVHDPSAMIGGPTTSLVRWELDGFKPSLHPGFSQLASKKFSASSSSELQPEPVLRRLEDLVIDGMIVSVQQLNLSTTLVFCISNGIVEFRSRPALDILSTAGEKQQASSLTEVGLEFTPSDPCLHTALSPNACATVTLDDSDIANLRLMRIPQAFDADLPDQAAMETMAGAFVIQFSISCSAYGNYHDDLSATMQHVHEQHVKGDKSAQAHRFTTLFLSDVHRVLSLNVDFSGDIKTEIYLKNALHQRTLSMQLSLGYWGDHQQRSLSSKVALGVLQLRWAALTFAMGLKLNPPGMSLSVEAEHKRTETVRFFFGIIAWTLSLMNFIVDEMFTLLAAVDEGASNHDLVAAKVSELNTPALALLFVSQSRLLLKYNFRFFRGISAEITQQRSQDPTWRELGTMFAKSPVPLHQIEKVLAEVDTSIRHVYEAGHVPESERKDIEKSMLITGIVHPKLWPAVEALLMKTARSLKEEVNVAELYFHDVSWLGLSDDQATEQWRKEHRLDVMRKVGILREARIRQCTRCCSVIEDAAPPKGTAGWLVNMWRTCVCGNWWMSVKDGGQTGKVRT